MAGAFGSSGCSRCCFFQEVLSLRPPQPPTGMATLHAQVPLSGDWVSSLRRNTGSLWPLFYFQHLFLCCSGQKASRTGHPEVCCFGILSWRHWKWSDTGRDFLWTSLICLNSDTPKGGIGPLPGGFHQLERLTLTIGEELEVGRRGRAGSERGQVEVAQGRGTGGVQRGTNSMTQSVRLSKRWCSSLRHKPRDL